MKKSVQDLSLEEILTLAIRIEENNAERLQSLVDLYMDYDDDIRDYFSKLKQEELDHKTLLLEKWSEKYGTKEMPDIDEEDVREVIEAVELENGEHILFDDITLDEVYKMVHNAETEAYLFYLKAATVVKDMDVKNLFSDLARMEFKHLENIPLFKGMKRRK